jgi:predicted GH43/DUF377 family glycosyl hydrolase
MNARYSTAGARYVDGRAAAVLRMDAVDHGVVLRHGDGPGGCDALGAREPILYEEDGVYHLFYDGASHEGWRACLAVSTDLQEWDKLGPILSFGSPGEDDAAAACSPWVIHDGERWHMFYLATPNGRDVPSFPYFTMKASAERLRGPWVKQPEVVPFRPVAGTYYETTASPGHIVLHENQYLQFFSSTNGLSGPQAGRRTLSLASTSDLDAPWNVARQPILPLDEEIENSSIYHDAERGTWYVFTNHIGIQEGGRNFTDAIWVYWSDTLTEWDASNKAIVLDGANCSWSHRCIGMGTVIERDASLWLVYDAPGGECIDHLGRDIGLARLPLPLSPPK